MQRECLEILTWHLVFKVTWHVTFVPTLKVSISIKKSTLPIFVYIKILRVFTKLLQFMVNNEKDRMKGERLNNQI